LLHHLLHFSWVESAAASSKHTSASRLVIKRATPAVGGGRRGANWRLPASLPSHATSGVGRRVQDVVPADVDVLATAERFRSRDGARGGSRYSWVSVARGSVKPLILSELFSLLALPLERVPDRISLCGFRCQRQKSHPGAVRSEPEVWRSAISEASGTRAAREASAPRAFCVETPVVTVSTRSSTAMACLFYGKTS
jgi:hypothetical protein